LGVNAESSGGMQHSLAPYSFKLIALAGEVIE
jgi:hypothetical protein